MQTTSFGAAVSRRRRTLGLTQSDLAQQVGCSTVTIRKIEADERRPSPQMAERLARFLELAGDDAAAFLRLARVEQPDASEKPLAGNLPGGLPALVGRAELLAALRNRLLRRDVRLLTLAGPGGVGKTSLALQLAESLGGEFPDGVFLVELAAVATAERVPGVIADTLGAPVRAGQSELDRAREQLGERRVLLVLDNLEQIAGIAAPVGALLAACPGLAVLATSRSALQAPGEQLISVAPLELPQDEGAAALGAPAVELFVTRARATRANFEPGDGRVIATICSRLDGLPLAIELVAARSAVIEPPELLRHLDAAGDAASLRLGGVDAQTPARHRTLGDAIDWSARILPEHHWLLFLQLAVFVDGFDLAAAEAVCADIGLLPPELLDGLQALVAAHLLTRRTDEGGATRFMLLQTIRAYALARLAAVGLEAEARARHSAHFLALAAEADAQLEGPEQALWYVRLEREHANLRAALEWSLQHAPATAANLGHHLWWFWLNRGHWREGLRWLEAILARAETLTPALEPAIVADLCKGAATIAKELCEYTLAERRYQQGLALERALGNPRRLATMLNNYGGMLHRQGRADEALACYQESLGHLRALELPAYVALMCNNIAGLLQEFGRFAEAQRFHDEAAALYQGLDDPRGLASSLSTRGELAVLRGDLATATALYQECLALYEACDDDRGRMTARNGLGIVAFCQGDHAGAIALQQLALPVAERQGDQHGLIFCLEGCAHSAGALGMLDAARLYGAAATQRERLGLPLLPAYGVLYDAALGQAAERHERRAWDATMRLGRTLTPQQALAIALALRASPATG